MTKREFLRNGLIVAGSSLLPTSALLAEVSAGHFSFSVPNTTDAYSRALFPYFWAEDLINLSHLCNLPSEVPQALEVNQDFFQLGRSWQVSVEDAKTLLGESQTLLAADQNGLDRAKTQFALVAGWWAARFQRKALAGTNWTADTQYAIDAHLLRILQAGGSEGSVSTLNDVTVEEVTEILRIVRQRNLLRLHTFRPEWEDVEEWLDSFLALIHELEDYDKHLAKHYVHPGSVTELTSYLNPSDPVVTVANDLRFGRLTTLVGQRSKVSVGNATSDYGKHLAEALSGIETMGWYIYGQVGETDLNELLREP